MQDSMIRHSSPGTRTTRGGVVTVASHSAAPISTTNIGAHSFTGVLDDKSWDTRGVSSE
jgi:hypothetical protein